MDVGCERFVVPDSEIIFLRELHFLVASFKRLSYDSYMNSAEQNEHSGTCESCEKHKMVSSVSRRGDLETDPILCADCAANFNEFWDDAEDK